MSTCSRADARASKLCQATSIHHVSFRQDVDPHVEIPGGRLNKKDGLTRYGNSHVKDKTS